MKSARQRSAIIGLAVMCWACNSANKAAPTTTVTTTSVAIAASTDMLRVQETVTFSATATRSDGSTSAVTDWSSSAPGVLSINPASGAATGVSAGQATIIARSDGVTATRMVRVVPQYSGKWSGTYAINTCTATEGFLAAGWCDQVRGGIGLFGLELSQTRDTVTGTLSFDVVFTGSVTGTMAVNGTLTLMGTTTFDTFSIALPSWSTNSTAIDVMEGTFSQRVTSTEVAGEAIHGNVLTSAVRSSQFLQSIDRGGSRPGVGRSLADLLKALVGK